MPACHFEYVHITLNIACVAMHVTLNLFRKKPACVLTPLPSKGKKTYVAVFWSSQILQERSFCVLSSLGCSLLIIRQIVHHFEENERLNLNIIFGV